MSNQIMMHPTNKKGFTLIELLVVISIISFLSTVVLGGLNLGRARGRDANKKLQLASVRSALNLFYQDKGTMPKNYNCDGTYCSGGTGNLVAIEDMSNPNNPQTESGKAYNQSMQELVAAKALAAVPHSPGGAPFGYYNYGSGSIGAVIFTDLETNPPSTTGPANSCRPFAATYTTRCFGTTNSSSIDLCYAYSYGSSGNNLIGCFARTIPAGGDRYNSSVGTYVSQDCSSMTTNPAIDYNFMGGPGAQCSQSSSQNYCMCNPY
jgi:prepilin-type N-terminal cleavage/methylation domain-containing protein